MHTGRVGPGRMCLLSFLKITGTQAVWSHSMVLSLENSINTGRGIPRVGPGVGPYTLSTRNYWICLYKNILAGTFLKFLKSCEYVLSIKYGIQEARKIPIVLKGNYC